MYWTAAETTAYARTALPSPSPATNSPCWLPICPACTRSSRRTNSSATQNVGRVGCLAGNCDAGCMGMLLLTGCLLCGLVGAFLAAWLISRRCLAPVQRPAARQSPNSSLLQSVQSSASCDNSADCANRQRRPSYYGALDTDCCYSTTPTYSASITSSMGSLIAQSAESMTSSPAENLAALAHEGACVPTLPNTKEQ